MYPVEDASRVARVYEQVVVDRLTAVFVRGTVSTTIETRDAVVADTLRHGNPSIERMTGACAVPGAPSSREEGDALVISVIDERLVKRLLIVEELRIQQATAREAVSLQTTLRAMRANVEHPEETMTGGRL